MATLPRSTARETTSFPSASKPLANAATGSIMATQTAKNTKDNSFFILTSYYFSFFRHTEIS